MGKTNSNSKYVYSFKEGKKEMKELLGGKGANLAEMTSLGIPVPAGFTITTEACEKFYEQNQKNPVGLWDQVQDSLQELEQDVDSKLGDSDNPLLVSVRSGAAISMPGMMDTVLNLGLNDKSVQGLIQKTNNERFAFDAYRRFINMFANVVMGLEHKYFEDILNKTKKDRGVKLDTDLNAEDLKLVVEKYKDIISKHSDQKFPQNPKEQLKMAIEAVFKSWNNDRAITYRRLNKITGLMGTAVNVQAMVFGNMGNISGTGVAFTRNPSTGEKKIYGEYLMNAQGEDVVAGIRTPLPLSQLQATDTKSYDELVKNYILLETHYKDMQDLEFTIQSGSLFILQTRTGKRTAQAAVKIAVDMVDEGLIDQDTAILRVLPDQLNQLLHKQLDPTQKNKFEILGKGLPASPGAAVGEVVFTAMEATKRSTEGLKVILVRTETSPEDIEGMHSAEGILTSCGGMTSHAAVVARGMGKCCVAGCQDITIDCDKKKLTVRNTIIYEGDTITLDGSTGEVYKDKIPVIDPQLSDDYHTLMGWADNVRTLKVRSNADSPQDADIARKFGAEGIGLCRTEHMFFEPKRIIEVQKMILADSKSERIDALSKLLPMQKSDFIKIFKVMKDLPITIRLLDPPLHEFLPKEDKEISELALAMNCNISDIKLKIQNLKELNPMLGHRGVRLAISYPEIAEMQIRAIIGAASEIIKQGNDIVPEIMVPFVGHADEIKFMKNLIDTTAIKVIEKENVKLHYKLGSMIEIPRAALVADKIAEYAQFFSFGTNDLTQMCLGYSRDDAGKFIPEYIKDGILESDPFESIDILGVGELIRLAVSKGRSVRKSLKLGICGEHGGDPDSITFCHKLGIEYVSCSPYRVPIARLAAAHAVLNSKN